MRLVKELTRMAKKKRKMGNIYGIVFLIISVFLIYTLIAKVQHIQAEKATYQKLVVQEDELKKEKAKLVKEVDSLNDTKRGTGGFGSTGTK